MKKNNHLRNQGDKETRKQDNSTSNLTPHSTLHTPLNILNDDIVSVARELRDEENAQLQVPSIVDGSQFTVDSSANGASIGCQSFVGGDLKSPTHGMRISNPHQQSQKVRLWLAAACLVGFLFGFGLRPTVSSLLSPTTPLTTQHSSPTTHNDTILLREVIHDTVFQTRVIIRNAAPHPVVAQAENAPTTQEDASRQQADKLEEAAPAVGCSMLCDDIPYAILARN